VFALALFLEVGKHNVKVKLTTLSEFINQHAQDINSIELMKIDVEGAELAVLKGITQQEHWNMIKQLVVEVHDVNNRVTTISRMLEDKGFTVTVSQEDFELHKVLNIFTVYATRSDKKSK
jgi:hypothetical protein